MKTKRTIRGIKECGGIVFVVLCGVAVAQTPERPATADSGSAFDEKEWVISEQPKVVDTAVQTSPDDADNVPVAPAAEISDTGWKIAEPDEKGAHILTEIPGRKNGEKTRESAGEPEGAPTETSADKEKYDEKQKHSARKRALKETEAGEMAVKTGLPESFPTVIPSGILYGVFNKEDGPILIDGSIIVPSGQILEFGPGSRIYIGGKYSTITVFGQLLAKGTAEEPIIFQSAEAQPNPWDWDRIYCRSKNRSEFEYCIITHCNYGIYVENGQASIANCRFENNSLHGLVVNNSNVVVRNSTFKSGHVLAVYCQPGAVVTAESLTVRDNITGIACDNKSSFELTGGSITRNSNGIAFKNNAAINIVAADITRNHHGVAAMREIPKRMREMVHENVVDIKLMTENQIEQLFKPPEEVKSIVLPKEKKESVVGEDFKAGFSALQAPRQQTESLIGNVTVGLKYFSPRSHKHPTGTLHTDDENGAYSYADTLIKQTRYLGEQSDDWYAGFQPETQLFLSGRKGMADVNLLADFYGNQWSDFQKNMFNLSVNFANQALVIGDFYENGTETSISGRQLTGIKITGSAWEMGRGTRRFGYNLAAGESEFPKDTGDNEIDLYNDKVDSAMSVRQQITYVAGINVKPTHNSAIIIKGIIARDQTDNPFLRKPITDPSVAEPIQAQTGCIGGEVTLLDGKLTIGAEIDLGSHDTLSSAYDTLDSEGVEQYSRNEVDVDWYMPEIIPSIGRVFSEFTSTDNYAGMANVSLLTGGYDLGLSFMEIRKDYFAAGNPYLETDRRRLVLTGEKQILEKLSVKGEYAFEQSYASDVYNENQGNSGPLFKNGLGLGGEYAFGGTLPTLILDYLITYESRERVGRMTTYDTTETEEAGIYEVEEVTRNKGYDARKLKNLIGAECKQRFTNGIEYSLRYRGYYISDISDYSFIDKDETDDETQHQLSGRFAFRIKKFLRNRTTFRVALKYKERDDFEGVSYKIGNQARFTLIPRKLDFQLSGEYSDRTDEEDNDDIGKRKSVRTHFYNVEGQLKLKLSSRFSITCMGRYEDSYDEAEGSTENYTAKIGGLHVTYLF